MASKKKLKKQIKNLEKQIKNLENIFIEERLTEDEEDAIFDTYHLNYSDEKNTLLREGAVELQRTVFDNTNKNQIHIMIYYLLLYYINIFCSFVE